MEGLTLLEKLLYIVEVAVFAGVVISLLLLGLSVDRNPSWQGWLFMEIPIVLIFILECSLKLLIQRGEYLCGRDMLWNLSDVILTIISVLDLCLSFAGISISTKSSSLLRGLRLVRVARAIQVSKTALLAELANLISGFIIGIPWLFWVMFTLTAVVYIMALSLRTLILSYGGDDFVRCGSGDSLNDPFHDLPAGCRLHYMYGQEYCSTLPSCMFTVFRCINGDCSSMSGRLLHVVFTQGWGTKFAMLYCFSIVCVQFGLYNVIIALFVESTMTGLKYTELQRKYSRLIESGFVADKVNEIATKIVNRVKKMRKGLPESTNQLSNVMRRLRRASTRGALEGGELKLTEQEFNQVINDSEVRALLEELDIEVEPRPGIFEIFNMDDDGLVSLTELISGLMRLRGELQKTDVVATQVVLEDLQQTILQIQTSTLSSQSRLFAMIDDLQKHIQPPDESL